MKKLMIMLGLSMCAPIFADDAPLLRVVLDKIKYEQWDNATAFASHARDPIMRDILTWYELRAGRGDFADYQHFLKNNADWPGLPAMLARGEKLIPQDLPAEAVVDFFGELPPQSAGGLVRFVKAQMDLSQNEQAITTLNEAVDRISIPLAAMNQISALQPDWAKTHIDAHVDYLLLEKKAELVAQYLPSLSLKKRDEVEMRIAVLRGKAPAPKTTLQPEAKIMAELLPMVGEVMAKMNMPAPLMDAPAVAFEKFRYAFEHKNRKAARQILRAQSVSREMLYEPEYWSEDDRRVRLAGDAIWEGNYQEAYEIAASHFLNVEEEGYGEAEWKAGFIALEFLKNKELARTHFQNFNATAKTPIALGRAGYWLGRAGDPSGYALGAKYQTSFYGQLAAEAGKLPQDRALIIPVKTNYGNLDLLKHDSIHAGLWFAAAKEPLLADRFFRHEAETLTLQDADILGSFAMDLKLPHAAVGIGKNLAERGEVIANGYYPMPDIFAQKLSVRPALAYAITRQESEFYQRAGSPVGAQGYMQLMPATAETMAKGLGLPFVEKDLMENGAYNIALGTGYLAKMAQRFDGKIPYMAVGYNAGPNRVDQWITHHGGLGATAEEAVKWIELIPFEETHNYVQRVLEGVYLYDAKLAGDYLYPPSDLLLKAYPLPQ